MHDVNDYKMVVIRNGEEDGWIYFFGDAIIQFWQGDCQQKIF